jgi:hypothetical protein
MVLLPINPCSKQAFTGTAAISGFAGSTIGYPYFSEQVNSYVLDFWIKKYYRWVFACFCF